MNSIFASEQDYEIRQSPLHGLGLFATRDIAAGTHVIRYSGPIVSTEIREKMTPEEKLYLYKIDDNYSIDGRLVPAPKFTTLCGVDMRQQYKRDPNARSPLFPALCGTQLATLTTSAAETTASLDGYGWTIQRSTRRCGLLRKRLSKMGTNSRIPTGEDTGVTPRSECASAEN